MTNHPGIQSSLQIEDLFISLPIEHTKIRIEVDPSVEISFSQRSDFGIVVTSSVITPALVAGVIDSYLIEADQQTLRLMYERQRSTRKPIFLESGQTTLVEDGIRTRPIFNNGFEQGNVYTPKLAIGITSFSDVFNNRYAYFNNRRILTRLNWTELFKAGFDEFSLNGSAQDQSNQIRVSDTTSIGWVTLDDLIRTNQFEIKMEGYFQASTNFCLVLAPESSFTQVGSGEFGEPTTLGVGFAFCAIPVIGSSLHKLVLKTTTSTTETEPILSDSFFYSFLCQSNGRNITCSAGQAGLGYNSAIPTGYQFGVISSGGSGFLKGLEIRYF